MLDFQCKNWDSLGASGQLVIVPLSIFEAIGMCTDSVLGILMPSSSELNIMLISCYLEQWPLHRVQRKCVTGSGETRGEWRS